MENSKPIYWAKWLNSIASVNELMTKLKKHNL